jgi:ligand-binding sensor domain-containing protein/anti-sigma regulatory factor (Ser/Thr protein kinase)
MLKSKIKQTILLLTLLLFSAFISAQKIPHRNLTTKDGLPSNTIYQIKQDKKDFIWIATANGLVRYDGKYFKAFNPKDIKDKEIIGLFIDNADKVWFWNLKGRLFYIKDDVIHIPNFAKDNLNIIAFEQDRSGNYYFISKRKGLFIVENDKVSFIAYRKSYFNLMNLHDTIHYGNNNELLKINKNELVDSIETFESNFKFKEQPETYRSFTKYLNNKTWLIRQRSTRIYKVNNKGKLTGMGFPNYRNLIGKDILNLYSDRQKRYWLITTTSIFVFDSTETKLERQFSLPYNNTINNFLHDKEGNYWLSTEKNGLYIIPNIDIKSHKTQTKVTKTSFVSSLSIANNTIFCGLENGKIYIKSLENKREKVINLNLDASINKIISGEKNSWILTPVRLFSIDNKTFKIKKFYQNQVNINYKTLYEYGDFIYVGNYAGVLKIDKTAFYDVMTIETWVTIQSEYAISDINKRTYAIERVKDEMWFGTTDGLYHYQKDSATLTRIPELRNTWITHIINKNDTVWVGTQTDGLFQIINKKVIQVFNETNGLISNNCKTLTIDDETVWVGTNNGLNKIDLRTNEIELINDLDGLSGNEINALVTDKNNIYIGNNEGLTSFDKTISTKNTTPPPIYLSKFQIFENDTILSDNYILDYNQDNIRLHFTGVSFRSQGTFTYKYRMLGVSKKWIETQVDFASYPILNPGKYTFEAYAINEDGVESEEPIQIKIYIKTPFWKTWWFTILCFLVGIIIVWGFVWYRFKQLNEKVAVENKFQKQIKALEMQALQSQMNPHFIFNVLNSIQHYLAINNSEQAMIYLSKFAKLIRIIFEYSKKTTISLTEEVDFLELYVGLEKLRFKDKIAVSFEIEQEIYTDAVMLPPLLIQPMIENAFKHGFLHKEEKGHLSIQFFIEKDLLKCRITDDGVGRQKAATMKKWKHKIHQSSGLSTTAERLEVWFRGQHIKNEHNNELFRILDLENEAGEAIGTQVEMTLNTYIVDEYQ